MVRPSHHTGHCSPGPATGCSTTGGKGVARGSSGGDTAGGGGGGSRGEAGGWRESGGGGGLTWLLFLSLVLLNLC